MLVTVHRADLLISCGRWRNVQELFGQAFCIELPPDRLDPTGVLRMLRKVMFREARVRQICGSSTDAPHFVVLRLGIENTIVEAIHVNLMESS